MATHQHLTDDIGQHNKATNVSYEGVTIRREGTNFFFK